MCERERDLWLVLVIYKDWDRNGECGVVFGIDIPSPQGKGRVCFLSRPCRFLLCTYYYSTLVALNMCQGREGFVII